MHLQDSEFIVEVEAATIIGWSKLTENLALGLITKSEGFLEFNVSLGALLL